MSCENEQNINSKTSVRLVGTVKSWTNSSKYLIWLLACAKGNVCGGVDVNHWLSYDVLAVVLIICQGVFCRWEHVKQVSFEGLNL